MSKHHTIKCVQPYFDEVKSGRKPFKEEPRRIPFDGSDAFNLVGQKFKFKLHQNIFFIAVETDRNGVYFNKTHISWADLEFIYDKWNDTLKEWQPCNKVA